MGKELKRMNYFDGLFLKAEDYNQDKEYQKMLQGFHNRYLHTWGIMSGLDVKPVTDSNMEVYVTEGAALDLTADGLDKAASGITADGSDGADIEKSISRQILIYEGHPDNPIDLSECTAGENIYIYASYFESDADWDSERGQGEKIHIWERSKLGFCTSKKPEDTKKNILLARVVPKEITKTAGGITFNETVIDSTCIFSTDTDGTPLRVYAGPYAKVLGLEKFRIKSGEDFGRMPYINLYPGDSTKLQIITYAQPEEQESDSAEIKKEMLEVSLESEQIKNINEISEKNESKSSVRFSGTVELRDNLSFEGALIAKKNGKLDDELEYEEAYCQLNSNNPKYPWSVKDGGMDVFRGGAGVAPDARIVWSEADALWKIGLENELSPVAYGEKWEKLIKSTVCDGMHAHSTLSANKGAALSAAAGNLLINKAPVISDNNIKFKNSETAWFGSGKKFGNTETDGSVLTGVGGGLLGTTLENQKAIVSWNNIGKVGIGSVNLTDSDDDLDISGSSRLLIGSNPVRFTSAWTAFPDITRNQAEICNDTTYHRALMIVGNQSAGQGRKVAVQDSLDVNGMLYMNGNMKIKNSLTVSAGKGNNGIIFPADPGGGSEDGAWLKYYARSGEACTLEIGTSNDGDDNILLLPSGNVGIGTLSPGDKLGVNGRMRVLTGTNPIAFTNSWSKFTEQSLKNAEICNDTSAISNSLIIAGNRSAGYERRVSIWDDLDVNGPLNVKGKLYVYGAIVPGVGLCEGNGIMFPKDPYGGWGDSAWIRYFSDPVRGGGENMTLEIGIANDSNLTDVTETTFIRECPYSWVTNPCGRWVTTTRTVVGRGGDRLHLYASGGTYIDGNFYYTSSKDYKENIANMSKTTVQKIVEELEPVEFNFKGDYSKTTMGFIAEDVPADLSAYDKKAISPMEIIAVLVNEVKEQEKILNKLKKKVAAIKGSKK
jgi:hypothetical protein